MAVFALPDDRLRRLVIKRHSAPVAWGEFKPDGGSCALCETDWLEGEREKHKRDCALFENEKVR